MRACLTFLGLSALATLGASQPGTPEPSSHAPGSGGIPRKGSQTLGVGAGAFAQNLVEVLPSSPALDTFSSSSFGGGALSLLAPACREDRGPLPFCQSCRSPACCSGWAPCRCSPSKTDRQPLASKPDSSRQELCDLGAGKPLRASVPKSVKWGTRLACAPWKEHPREGSALAGPLEASPPGSGASSQAYSPSRASGVSHPLLALHRGVLASGVQLCLPRSLAVELGAGKKA